MEEAVKNGTFTKMGGEGMRKKESQKYTGDLIQGIATMHKSNMVPVFADEDDRTGSKQATEIAKMRRG